MKSAVHLPLFLLVFFFGALAHSQIQIEKSNERELFFKPEDNQVRISSGQLSWKFENPETIWIGDRRISGGKISAQVLKTPRNTTPRKFQKSGNTSDEVFSLGFSWPDEIIRSGKLLILDPEGNEIASFPVTSEERNDWARIIEKDEEKFLKELSLSSYGLLDLDTSVVEALQEEKGFSVCLLATGQQSETFRACTANLQLSKSVRAQVEPTVFVNGIDATDTGVVNFSDLKQMAFKLRFGSGNTIEFNMASKPIEFLDVVAAKNQKEIHITGRGAVPLAKVKTIETQQAGLWPSEREKQNLWKLEIPKASPLIKLNASWGLVLTFVIDFEELPTEEDRIVIASKILKGTYTDHTLVRLQANPAKKITSTETEVVIDSAKKPVWKFPTPKVGEFNSARVQIQKQNATNDDPIWTANHEVFRAYPGEFQALIGPGMVSMKRFFAVGELNASYFSSLRWGGTVSYLRFLTPLSVESSLAADGSGEEVLTPIGVLDVSLKYNFIEGAWNQDELLGLILSYENQSLRNYSANLLGVGAYWARKLPKLFDLILSRFPLLGDHKKYVDMQFVYYPMALTKGDQTKTNYELNFHGKVFWTQRLYGQMGFGLKQIQFTKDAGAAIETQVNLRSSYGTLGLGYLF